MPKLDKLKPFYRNLDKVYAGKINRVIFEAARAYGNPIH